MSWKKTRRIGEGSLGTVWIAESVNSPEKTVVVKSTVPWDSGSSSLIKEAKFLKLLRGNPFIVRCYGVDTSIEGNQETYNMLIEHAPGGTLADILLSGRGIMPQNHVAYFSYMLLRGLSCIHSKNLVHCDIKPSNALIFHTRNGSFHLKLSDFGSSKHILEKETGDFRGTPRYGAPEAVEDGVHGKAADIYSFGCTVLEMLRSGLESSYKPESESELARDFLMKCLGFEPDDRWSADMLLNHEFIRTYTKGMFSAPGCERSNLIQIENPFGSDWIEEKNMFSDGRTTSPPPSIPAPAAVTTYYQLFPEDQKSYYQIYLDEIQQEVFNEYMAGGMVPISNGHELDRNRIPLIQNSNPFFASNFNPYLYPYLYSYPSNL